MVAVVGVNYFVDPGFAFGGVAGVMQKHIRSLKGASQLSFPIKRLQDEWFRVNSRIFVHATGLSQAVLALLDISFALGSPDIDLIFVLNDEFVDIFAVFVGVGVT